MNLLSPQWTLLTGIALAFFVQGKDIQNVAKKWGTQLLQLSVILLGASLNFHDVLAQGAGSVLITFSSIMGVFLLGYLGRKLFKVEEKQGILISMGTAICGGSAIGALAPVLGADTLAITVSIGVVFLLNALAVFIFPPLGHFFHLTQDQFGLWSALAIHDTSSVVASASLMGSRALEVATTVKLIRALWIIPVTLFFSLRAKDQEKKKIAIPWFILGFIALSMLFTFTDVSLPIKEAVKNLAKLGFALTLFLIGLTFNWGKIKEVGARPLLLGVSLWVIVSTLSLVLIKLGM